MNSNEIYRKYLEAERERIELENKIEQFIEKWKNGETVASNKTIEEAIDKGYIRLEELKKTEEKIHSEYIQQQQREDDKRRTDISVEHKLGVRPTDLNITGGVLASNASDSHLIAETKTPEQLEQEKNQLLANIKSRVQSGELSLAEASKLATDVNNSYNFYQSEEKSTGFHR